MEARRSSRLQLSFAFLTRACFVFLILLPFTSTTAVATGIRRENPRLDHILARQETESSSESSSLELATSSTDFVPVPSSSGAFSTSFDAIPTASSVFSSASSASSSSSPSQSPLPSSTTPVSLSSEAASSTSFTSVSSASAPVSESSSFAESSSSISISSATSTSSPRPSTTSISATAFTPSQPATTLVIADAVTPITSTNVETASAAPSESVTPSVVGAASTGFWGNKGAVAATFTVVSLIVSGLLIVALVAYLKKRRNAKQQQQDYDLYGDPSFIDNSGDPYSSPSGSMREKPLDPFTSNDVVYTGYGFQEPSAGVAYAETSSNTRILYDATVRPYQEQAGYIPAADPQLSDTSHSSGHNTYRTQNSSQASVKATPTKQYMLPSQSQAQAKTANYYPPTNTFTSLISPTAPVPSNKPPARASVDSFYGFRGNQQSRSYLQ